MLEKSQGGKVPVKVDSTLCATGKPGELCRAKLRSRPSRLFAPRTPQRRNLYFRSFYRLAAFSLLVKERERNSSAGGQSVSGPGELCRAKLRSRPSRLFAPRTPQRRPRRRPRSTCAPRYLQRLSDPNRRPARVRHHLESGRERAGVHVGKVSGTPLRGSRKQVSFSQRLLPRLTAG
jgi:hypothetical protein